MKAPGPVHNASAPAIYWNKNGSRKEFQIRPIYRGNSACICYLGSDHVIDNAVARFRVESAIGGCDGNYKDGLSVTETGCSEISGNAGKTPTTKCSSTLWHTLIPNSTVSIYFVVCWIVIN